MGLRERAGDQHIIELAEQGQGILRGEGGIGLVHQEDGVVFAGVLRQAADIRAFEQHARGGVGVCQGNGAALHQAVHIHLELGGQRHGLVIHAKEVGVHRVEGVGHVRRKELLPSKKGRKGKGQHLVRAVATENHVGADPVHLGDGSAQGRRIHVGVEAQGVRRNGGDGLRHLRGRRIGVLVGVELDELHVFGLLARHIGDEA